MKSLLYRSLLIVTVLLSSTFYTHAQTTTPATKAALAAKNDKPAAAPSGPVDEPFWLPDQTYTTSKLFTAATVRRQANRCPVTVYHGNIYTIYARQGDERMMVAKIPLNGSPPVIQPLCSDAKAPGAILSENNHKIWVIQVDRAGYVHICGNMHTSQSVLFWRSNKPEDISAFSYSVGNPALDVPIAGGPSFPTLRSAPNGQIFWNAQQGTPSLSSYDETTKKWTMLGAAPDKKGHVYFNFTPYRQHANLSEKGGLKQTGLGMAWDSNGRMHIAIGMLNKNVFRAGHGFLATDIIYAYSDDGGKTVHKSNGTPIQFPIGATDGTANQGEIVLREQDDPQCKWLEPWPGISVDKMNRPIISAKSYATGNHLLRLEGGKWVDYKGDVPGIGSTDPSGVIIGKDPNGNLRRYWNPTGKNFATLKLPDEVYRYDTEHYRDTGELVWTSRNGSAAAATLTIYRTVFARVSKVAPAQRHGF